MADELMFEGERPCPCGRGVIRYEAWEHDTWVSGQRIVRELRCDECSRTHELRTELAVGVFFVLKEAARKLDEAEAALTEHRRRVKATALERYFPLWLERILSLKTKAAIKRECGGHDSDSTFYRHLRMMGIENYVRDVLESRPEEVLRKLNVEEAELAAEFDALRAEAAALDSLKREVNSHRVPPAPWQKQ